MKTLEQIRLEIAGLWEEFLAEQEFEKEKESKDKIEKRKIYHDQIKILKDHLRNNKISWATFAHQIKIKRKEFKMNKNKFILLAAESLRKGEKDFEKFISDYGILLQPKVVA